MISSLSRCLAVGCNLAAGALPMSNPLAGAVASLSLPREGDSYTIDGWKRNLAVVCRAKESTELTIDATYTATGKKTDLVVQGGRGLTQK